MDYGSMATNLIGGALDFAGGLIASNKQEKAQRNAVKTTQYLNTHKYRIAMEDMRQAGLNPILAYQTMGGGTPSISGGAPYPNMLEGLAGSARELMSRETEVRKKAHEMDLIQEEIKKRRADTENTRAQTNLTHFMQAKAVADIDLARSAAERNRHESLFTETRNKIANRQEEIWEKPTEVMRAVNDWITGGRRINARDVQDSWDWLTTPNPKLKKGWDWMTEDYKKGNTPFQRMKRWWEGK